MTATRTLAVTAAALTAVAATALALQPTPPTAQPAQPATPNTPQTPATPGITQMLVDALTNTEGCLGVDIAQFGISQRAAIVAWFENKPAALRWYHHPTHQFLMRSTGNNPEENTPLEHIDDDTPIMVIASIVMADQDNPPVNPDNPMIPIHSISIELYAPLPGGAMLNGRLAPLEFPIQHMDGAPERNNESPDPTDRER